MTDPFADPFALTNSCLCLPIRFGLLSLLLTHRFVYRAPNSLSLPISRNLPSRKNPIIRLKQWHSGLVTYGLHGFAV